MSATSVRLSAPMDLRLELALVGELDVDLVGRLDDMRIGEDVAVVGDDEAPSRASGSRSAATGPLSRALAGSGLLARNEAAEELLDLLVLDPGHLRRRAARAPPAWC